MGTSTDGGAVAESRTRLPAVDGLRAIACMLVLVFHSFEFTGINGATLPWGVRQLALFGNAGVDIFVVLSGFCLFLPIARRPSEFRAGPFWRQRIRRLVPAYYASMVYVVTLTLVLKLLCRVLGVAESAQGFPSMLQWLSHMLFIHTLSTKTWMAINPSYWSLGLEAQFYLVLPLIVVLFRRYGVAALAASAVLGFIFQIVLYLIWSPASRYEPSHFLWGASVLGRLAEFGAGMIAAVIVARSNELGRAARILVGLGPLLGFGYLLSLSYWEPGGFVDVAVWGASTGLTLIGCASKAAWYVRTLQSGTAGFLGLISYSFYLVHQPTVYCVSQVADRVGLHQWANWAAQLTVGGTVSVGLAFLGYSFLERPFLRVKPTPTEARLVEGLSSRIGLRAAR